MEQNKNNDTSPFHDIDEKDKRLQQLSIGAGMAAAAVGAVLHASIDSVPQSTQLPKVEITYLDQNNTPDALQAHDDQYRIPSMAQNQAPQEIPQSVLHPELANQILVDAVASKVSSSENEE